MRFGLNLPTHGALADPSLLVELALNAEDAGWDGFFVWDHIAWQSGGKPAPLADPWIVLAAIAAQTQRIQLGPLVTPLARRRPWKFARETVTLDHLSGGRLTLGVGLGAWRQAEFEAFAEEADEKRRGDMLDEALALLLKFWQGNEVTQSGEHYQVNSAAFLPKPVQMPRIPIWVAGSWRNNHKLRPFRRAAQFDGIFPFLPSSQITPEAFHAIRAYIDKHRTSAQPFDVVCSRRLADNKAVTPATLEAFAQEGVTWWLTSTTPSSAGIKTLQKYIRQGPPR